MYHARRYGNIVSYPTGVFLAACFAASVKPLPIAIIHTFLSKHGEECCCISCKPAPELSRRVQSCSVYPQSAPCRDRSVIFAVRGLRLYDLSLFIQETCVFTDFAIFHSIVPSPVLPLSGGLYACRGCDRLPALPAPPWGGCRHSAICPYPLGCVRCALRFTSGLATGKSRITAGQSAAPQTRRV